MEVGWSREETTEGRVLSRHPNPGRKKGRLRVRDWGADPANEQGRAGGGGTAHGEKNVGNWKVKALGFIVMGSVTKVDT